MLRDFMPGECSLGAEVPLFAALDQNSLPSAEQAAAIEQTKNICRSCVQLPYCESQRQDIADVLSARGVGQTVIGAEIIEGTLSQEDPRLIEPKCTFDLAVVPNDPRQRLEVMRQAIRSGQLRVRGAPPVHSNLIKPRLYEQSAAERPDIPETILQDATDNFVWVALRYRVEQRHTLSRRKQRSGPSEAEIVDMEALQAAFLDDVQALIEMDIADPAYFARVHKPEFYAGIFDAYEQNFNITRGRLRDFCRYLNPIPKIEEYIDARRKVKEAANTQTVDSAALAIINEQGHRAPLAKKIKENLKLNRTRFIPEAKPYFTLITQSGRPNPRAEIDALLQLIRSLREKHSDVDMVALAYIAYHRSDPDKALQDFKINHDALQSKYLPEGENTNDITKKQLQRLTFEHETIEEAEAAIQTYLARVAKIRLACEAAQCQPSDSFVRGLAIYYTGEIDTQNVLFEYKKYRLIQSKKLRILDGWMRETIIQLYEDETYEKTALYLSIFLQREYLRTAFATEDMPPTPHKHVEPDKGRYIAWHSDFLAFTTQEQEAILVAFHLDRLVLGRDVDVKSLKAHFGTEDIAQYVDTYLLPYTFPRTTSMKNAASLLDGLRYKFASSQPQNAAHSLYKECDALVRWLASTLRPQTMKDNDPEAKKYEEGLQSLVRRVARTSPGLIRHQYVMQKLAHSYLNDVERITELHIGNAYAVALHHNPDFCAYFIAPETRNGFTRSRVGALLERPKVQPVLELRIAQALLVAYEPQFAQRGIKQGYCRRTIFEYRHNPKAIDNLLKSYDKAAQKFAANTEVSDGVIRAFCFGRNTKRGVIVEIEDWLASMANLDPVLKQKVHKEHIKYLAQYKRGDELKHALTDRVELVDTIEHEYRLQPHPAVDRHVIEIAVFKHSQPPRSWLVNEYIPRWEHVQKSVDTTDIPIETQRRLILTGAKNPLASIIAYKHLCQQFANDPYIQRWMIDEAVVWSVKRARESLGAARHMLKNHSVVSLDADLTGEGGYQRSEVIADTSSAARSTIGSAANEENAAHRDTIATLLKKAPPIEKAAVAAVYNLPWLAPSDLRDENHGDVDLGKLLLYYNVTSLHELHPIVETILAHLIK